MWFYCLHLNTLPSKVWWKIAKGGTTIKTTIPAKTYLHIYIYKILKSKHGSLLIQNLPISMVCIEYNDEGRIASGEQQIIVDIDVIYYSHPGNLLDMY